MLRLIAPVLALVAVLTGSPPAAAQGAGDLHERRTFTNDAGSREYVVFAPAAARAGGAPLVVHLHGCTQDADDVEAGTGWSDLAAREGFAVVYPEQPLTANSSNCWNWFQPTDQARDAGEPSIIAGITEEVAAELGADRDRIFVSGLSGGGAMAVVMGATYPDVYAAIGIGAGCEFEGLPCIGAPSALPPDIAGEHAFQAMGEHARVMPFHIVQGDADLTVPPANADLVLAQWQATDDWADDGDDDGSIPREPVEVRSEQVPDGYAYEVERYADGHGCAIGERWLVAGMGHAWSGGRTAGTYTDPAGPDATGGLWAFFSAHPLGSHEACVAAAAGPAGAAATTVPVESTSTTAAGAGAPASGGELPRTGGGAGAWPVALLFAAAGGLLLRARRS